MEKSRTFAKRVTKIMAENWKRHPYWNAYEISDLGRVKRIARAQGGVVGKILKPSIRYGYFVVWLNPGHKQRGIHQLVLETFVGLPKNDEVCRHLNGIKADNFLKNLKWGTPQENYADSVSHGTAARREKNGRAVLTGNQVRSIRIRYASGLSSQRLLAREFGVTHPTIQAIVENRSWRE